MEWYVIYTAKAMTYRGLEICKGAEYIGSDDNVIDGNYPDAEAEMVCRAINVGNWNTESIKYNYAHIAKFSSCEEAENYFKLNNIR